MCLQVSNKEIEICAYIFQNVYSTLFLLRKDLRTSGFLFKEAGDVASIRAMLFSATWQTAHLVLFFFFLKISYL